MDVGLEPSVESSFLFLLPSCYQLFYRIANNGEHKSLSEQDPENENPLYCH